MSTLSRGEQRASPGAVPSLRRLRRASLAVLLFSGIAFIFTMMVGITGFAAMIADQLTLTVYLGPALFTAEAITAGAFLLGLALHLGYLLLARRY